MKKYIILSVNDNLKYLFWVPLTVWAWKQFGWEPVIFFHGNQKSGQIVGWLFNQVNYTNFVPLGAITDYQPETITQVSRLYGACVVDGYLMTGDIDMIPLSDYWKPKENEITSYGRDLTDYHYPICYIGMDSEKWKEVMNIDGDDYQYYMQRDLDMMPQAKSQVKDIRWVTDQDLITERINASQFPPYLINRGTYKNGYPIGRVDRSAWTLNHKTYIDAHLPHDILTNEASFKKVMELLHLNWPAEDWKWFIEYYREFKRMMK